MLFCILSLYYTLFLFYLYRLTKHGDDSAIDDVVDMEYQCSDDVVLTIVGKLHITYLSCIAYLRQAKEVVDILQNRPE